MFLDKAPQLDLSHELMAVVLAASRGGNVIGNRLMPVLSDVFEQPAAMLSNLGEHLFFVLKTPEKFLKTPTGGDDV